MTKRTHITRAAATDVVLADLLWEAQNLANRGYTITPGELRWTTGEPDGALDDAVFALEALQTDLPPAVSSTLQAGDRVGDFTIRGIIGQGGMGIVYEAAADAGEERVALKVLNPATVGSAVALMRFQREARVAERLEHDNIVKVLAAGESDGLFYYVMERVEGDSLAEMIDNAGENLPDAPACRSWVGRFAGVAAGLEHAHRAGIVHRDVKPPNILIDRDGRLRLVDFGIAYGDDCETLTATSAILGTPLYMAPEQARGEGHQLGPPADVYSLAASLYEVLTGRPPFEPTNGYAQLLAHIVERPPRSPRRLNPAIPREVEAVILKCLEKKPAARYDSADAMRRDLERAAQGQRVRARVPGPLRRLARRAGRRPGLAAMILALAGTVTLLALLLFASPASSFAENASSSWIDLRRDAWLVLFASRGSQNLAMIEKKLAAWEPSTPDEREESTVLQAWVSWKRQRSSRALEILREPETLESTKAARLLRGFVLREEWKLEEARAEFTTAEETPFRTRIDHVLYALYLDNEMGQPDRALEEAAGLVEACPDYLPVRVLLAHLYKTRGKYRPALDACGTLSMLRPGDPAILLLRGEIRWMGGKREEAKKDLLAALAKEPRNGWTRFRLLTFLIEEGKRGRAEAMQLIEDGLALDPGSAGLLNLRGWRHESEGRYDEAIADYRSALKADPYQTRAQANLPTALTKAGRDDEASAVTDAMLADPRQPPRNLANLLNHRALSRWRRGDREGTFQDLRRAMKICYRPMLQNNLAYFLIQEERYGDAENELNRLLELIPAQARAWARRGYCRMHTFDLEGAREDIDHSMKLTGAKTAGWVLAARALLAGLLETPEEVRRRYAAAMKRERSPALLLHYAGFLIEHPGEPTGLLALLTELRRVGKAAGTGVGPRLDEVEVFFRGRQEGWEAAVRTWNASALAEGTGTADGRFERLRAIVTGAQGEAGPYRTACRALLEKRPVDVDALAALPVPPTPAAAWVIGAALLESDRDATALPHLRTAAESLGHGACRLDAAACLIKIGRTEAGIEALDRALAGELPLSFAVSRLQQLGVPPTPAMREPFKARKGKSRPAPTPK